MVPSQKTWTGKVGDTKTFTITTDPADASDSVEVIAATTAASSDTAIVTVVNNGTGFDAVIAGEGSATINFTSGSLAASITVTGQAAG
ncbi:Ig-like domain-containing protein [Enterococcus hulanensis]|nr:Ig-like domain-containing protein [Enterococcus hulanensis]